MISLLRLAVVGAALTLFAQAQEIAKPLVLVLVGPPGSGKTTQAAVLKRRLTLPVIAVDELRSAPSIDEALHKRVQQTDAARGFILDGYPSTRAQAEYLTKLVAELKLPNPLIVQIDVKDDIVRKRLASSKNAKDQGSTLEQRLMDYHREMDLYRSYYPESDIWTIIGDRAPAEVTGTIVSLLADRDK